jgi:hypothetical protein
MFSIHNMSAEIICQGPCRGRAALRLPAALLLLLMEKNIASCRDVGLRQGVLPSAQNCWLIWPAGLVVLLLVPLVLHRHHQRRLHRKLAPRDMPYDGMYDMGRGGRRQRRG